MASLVERRCRELPPGTLALGAAEIALLLPEAPGWALTEDKKHIVKTYEFKNFHETMAFVNAAAWVAHQEDHHPDLEVSYKRCRITYWTHTVGGVSENDLICAAKLEMIATRA